MPGGVVPALYRRSERKNIKYPFRRSAERQDYYRAGGIDKKCGKRNYYHDDNPNLLYFDPKAKVFETEKGIHYFKTEPPQGMKAAAQNAEQKRAADELREQENRNLYLST